MRKILVLAAALGLTGCGSMAFLSSPPPVFVVFFDGTSTDVTPTGHKIIDDVAAAAHRSEDTRLNSSHLRTSRMPSSA